MKKYLFIISFVAFLLVVSCNPTKRLIEDFTDTNKSIDERMNVLKQMNDKWEDEFIEHIVDAALNPRENESLRYKCCEVLLKHKIPTSNAQLNLLKKKYEVNLNELINVLKKEIITFRDEVFIVEKPYKLIPDNSIKNKFLSVFSIDVDEAHKSFDGIFMDIFKLCKIGYGELELKYDLKPIFETHSNANSENSSHLWIQHFYVDVYYSEKPDEILVRVDYNIGKDYPNDRSDKPKGTDPAYGNCLLNYYNSDITANYEVLDLMWNQNANFRYRILNNMNEIIDPKYQTKLSEIKAKLMIIESAFISKLQKQISDILENYTYLSDIDSCYNQIIPFFNSIPPKPNYPIDSNIIQEIINTKMSIFNDILVKILTSEKDKLVNVISQCLDMYIRN